MQVVGRTCACAIFLDHLVFRLFIFCSHSQNQEEFTVFFSWRLRFNFFFFKGSVWIWSLCEFPWSFGLQLQCTGSIFYFRKKISLPSMKAVVRACTCAIFLDHLNFRLFMFGSHSYLKSGWIHCELYFELEVHLPIFWGSC